jgi:hypothetical protein
MNVCAHLSECMCVCVYVKARGSGDKGCYIETMMTDVDG